MEKNTTEHDIFKSLTIRKNNQSEDALHVARIESPLGDMIALADQHYLHLLGFTDGKNLVNRINNIMKQTSRELVSKDNSLLIALKNEMKDYFDGKLKVFKTPVRYFGTDYQKESWNELAKIKYGETLSYGQLASRLGKGPSHSRAVGACAGANQLIIVIPCHRLIAARGKQGGFGAGADRKSFLLNHEQKFK